MSPSPPLQNQTDCSKSFDDGHLAPTDGFLSLGVGGSYTQGNMKISGGVRYVKIGDADALESPPNSGIANAAFRDNSAVGVGVKVGWTF